MKRFLTLLCFMSISVTAIARTSIDMTHCYFQLDPALADDAKFLYSSDNVNRAIYRQLTNGHLEAENNIIYRDGLPISRIYKNSDNSEETIYTYQDRLPFAIKSVFTNKKTKKKEVSTTKYDYDGNGNLFRITFSGTGKPKISYINRMKLEDGSFKEFCITDVGTNYPNIDVFKLTPEGVLSTHWSIGLLADDVQQALKTGDERRVYGIMHTLQNINLPNADNIKKTEGGVIDTKLGQLFTLFYLKKATETGFKLIEFSPVSYTSQRLIGATDTILKIFWFSKYFDLLERIEPANKDKDEVERSREIIDVEYDQNGNWIKKTYYKMKFVGIGAKNPYIPDPTGQIVEREIEYK